MRRVGAASQQRPDFPCESRRMTSCQRKMPPAWQRLCGACSPRWSQARALFMAMLQPKGMKNGQAEGDKQGIEERSGWILRTWSKPSPVFSMAAIPWTSCGAMVPCKCSPVMGLFFHPPDVQTWPLQARQTLSFRPQAWKTPCPVVLTRLPGPGA